MPPKYHGFGDRRKDTFKSMSAAGIRRSTYVRAVIPTVDQDGNHVIEPPVIRTEPSEWEDVVKANKTKKRNEVEDRARNWASILPLLLEAFKQGCGVKTPSPSALAPIEDPLLCSCPEKEFRFVRCIFKCGIRHFRIQHCKKCKDHSLPVVLMRRQLFPLTPKNPNVAIHIEQIRSMHLMHYICRTSIHAISEWAKAEYHYQLPIPASFKQRLSEALPMYARMMLNLEKGHKELSNLESGCPACKYMDGPKTVAADGNFQLTRYSRENERSKDINYQGQEEVDRHWADEGCSNFQELNKKGGSKRYLDQTGVFACTCGHGYPLVAMDMTTPGETFGYILSCLKQVVQMPHYGTNIRICYDVGCKLRTSLEKTESLACIKNVPIAVGIFHILNHSPACQLSCHPRVNAGWGLQDGEHLERMWSNLSGFISMTRSMSSLNRRLTISTALEFYAQQKIDNIGINLKRKFRRACLLRRDALKALRKVGIEEDDEEKLQNLQNVWDQQIRNTLASITNGSGRFAASNRAIENLRVAIAIFDLIDNAFRVQGNGHNRTQSLAAQRQAARDQVARKLKIYNEKICAGPVFGFEEYDNANTVLSKQSHFRFRMNITNLLTGDQPYDAFHGLQRANEELIILKDEATSVIKYADTLTKQLQDILQTPIGPYSLKEYYKRKGGLLMLARKLHHVKAWKKEQRKLLVRIADGTATSITTGAADFKENGDEEEDLLVDTDGVTDELSRVEEEVADDQTFEVDTEFVDMFPGDDNH
ncbi:hypothetical protein INT45_014315 [Circinella minor]|uniref:CxC1-like cysteine cluster associated with KDZ transposases domain-containing protein n=1 Tax=Circinella minor TaxID=1195481 RepID=A0A8H7RL51_9FUNG|nr:hypothetical protein INT45_014315 [Circinella minor]